LRTAPAKWVGTLPAKLHALWILKSTAWAVHGCALRHGRASGKGAYGQKPRRPSLICLSWMVCQYSRRALVSSEKHGTAADTGADREG
jgi:hypothetical protein